MPVSPALAILRIFGGLGLVIGVGYFGYAGRSLWVLPVLALIFTVSFGLGRWRAWALAVRTGALGQAVLAQIGTYGVQLVLCAVFFLIGRGLASLTGGVETQAFAAQDWLWLAGFAVYALAVGLLVVVFEQKPLVAPLPANAPVFNIDPTPVTLDTFWAGHHYSNKDNVYNDEVETTLDTARAYVKEADIDAEETRLGVRLPATLRRLYALQNGGGALDMFVPCPEGLRNSEDGWINPFSGYEDLKPLRDINTLQYAIEAYADPVDQPDMFPTGSNKMIVLARWYSETLFLDYRHSDTPTVGFVDFEMFEPLNSPDWEAHVLSWPDFDTFFAELRREAC